MPDRKTIYKDFLYNINNEFNDEFSFEQLCNNGRYPKLKAYIKSFLDGTQKNYDGDVSKYSMTHYQKAWSYLNNGRIQLQFANSLKFYKKNNFNGYKYEIEIDIPEAKYLYEKVFSGDTLNSMKTIFNHFIEQFLIELGSSKNYKMTNFKYEWLLDEFDNIFSDQNMDSVAYSRLILDQFEMFAGISATIGNQFPCPLYFNVERSNYGMHDFPDLLLLAIHDYFQNDSTDTLSQLFKNSRNAMKSCQNWLNIFGEQGNKAAWDEFVRIHHFQEFVHYNHENSCFDTPIVLWEGHSFSYLNLPNINIEFYKYLQFVNSSIILRGRRIENTFKINESILTEHG